MTGFTRAGRPHPAAIYNEKRRIVFSTFHRDGPEKAHTYLDGYRPVLGPTGFIGLKAELDFYENHRREYGLAVAADVGDATDFIGSFRGQQFRFDVTTNESVKSLKDYERFQREGSLYKLALIDRENGELIDIVDVNFPFCDGCGDDRLFDVALLLGEHKSRDGGHTGDFDQVHFRLCPECGPRHEGTRLTTHGLCDIESARLAHNEAQDSVVRAPSMNVNAHVEHALRYLRKTLNENIVALAGNRYTTVKPWDGDGYWETYIEYSRPLIRHHLPIEFGEVWTE